MPANGSLSNTPDARRSAEASGVRCVGGTSRGAGALAGVVEAGAGAGAGAGGATGAGGGIGGTFVGIGGAAGIAGGGGGATRWARPGTSRTTAQFAATPAAKTRQPACVSPLACAALYSAQPDGPRCWPAASCQWYCAFSNRAASGSAGGAGGAIGGGGGAAGGAATGCGATGSAATGSGAKDSGAAAAPGCGLPIMPANGSSALALGVCMGAAGAATTAGAAGASAAGSGAAGAATTAGTADSSTAGGTGGGAAATGGARLPSAAASSAARGDVACDPVIPAKGSVGVGCAVGGSTATELVSCVVTDVIEPLGGRDAVRGAEAVGADAGGAAMVGGRETDLGAASMSPMPANGSLGAIIAGGGGVGSATATSGGSGDVTGGGVESNDALEGGGGGGVRCCTGGGADAPATAAITPDAASEM